MANGTTQYRLRILHTDQGSSSGDATVIALYQVTNSVPAFIPVKVIVVDTGSAGDGVTALNRAWTKLGLAKVKYPADAIIATHYDPYYCSGLIPLAKGQNAQGTGTPPIVGPNTAFYDRGQQGYASGEPGTGSSAAYLNTTFSSQTKLFSDYRSAIASLLGASSGPTWQTAAVARSTAGGADGWTNGDTPLTYDFFEDLAGNSTVTPLSCKVIAVNGYMPDSVSIQANPLAVENSYSLALLLQFGNFTYFHGGGVDLAVEGGNGDVPGLARYLNGLDIKKSGKNLISVAKLAQQGSTVNANSAAFLAVLSPAAAIVTCGTYNSQAGSGSDNAFQPLTQRLPGSVRYYTGDPGFPIVTNQPDVVCGHYAPGATIPMVYGDISIEVTAAQAAASGTQFDVSYATMSSTGVPRYQTDSYVNPQ